MAKNTVKLKNYMPTPIMEEYTATAVAITPGKLVELTSAGLVQAHATAAGNVLPAMFVVEDELQGGGIDTNLAASSKVQVWIPTRGDQVYALLKTGETVAIGDALESAGAGLLQKHVADTWTSANVGTVYGNAIVGVALEAMTASGSTRIKVRIV